jgi:hypothetical protein
VTTRQFQIPAELRHSIENVDEVSVTLQSDVTWSPRRIKLGLDERKLSVSVLAVGFERAPNVPAVSNL